MFEAFFLHVCSYWRCVCIYFTNRAQLYYVYLQLCVPILIKEHKLRKLTLKFKIKLKLFNKATLGSIVGQGLNVINKIYQIKKKKRNTSRNLNLIFKSWSIQAIFSMATLIDNSNSTEDNFMSVCYQDDQIKHKCNIPCL